LIEAVFADGPCGGEQTRPAVHAPREIVVSVKQMVAGSVQSQQDGRMMNSTRLAHGAIVDQGQVK
jgi:hypothetical protein